VQSGHRTSPIAERDDLRAPMPRVSNDLDGTVEFFLIDLIQNRLQFGKIELGRSGEGVRAS
jgi:hypothetical protein